jgi:hypothetical protein
MSESTLQEPLKFAYWVPNVSGGLVVSTIEQRTSWDYDYNVELARTAERVGFEYALSQVRPGIFGVGVPNPVSSRRSAVCHIPRQYSPRSFVSRLIWMIDIFPGDYGSLNGDHFCSLNGAHLRLAGRGIAV